MATQEDRSDSKLRDAIAIFSHSQVHCLGLITFLARAISDGFGFVVLDDPIIASDESHRAPFVHQGLDRLLSLPFQVILLTQDNGLKRDIAQLYGHVGIEVFHLSLNSAGEGTVVEPHDGSVRAQLSDAALYTKSDALSMRKTGCEKLRDVTELVLKKIIVKGANAEGKTIDISTLNEPIERLLPQAVAYFTDPKHPNQVRYLSSKLSPGKHDDDVPVRSALTTCLGIMKDLDATYLS